MAMSMPRLVLIVSNKIKIVSYAKFDTISRIVSYRIQTQIRYDTIHRIQIVSYRIRDMTERGSFSGNCTVTVKQELRYKHRLELLVSLLSVMRCQSFFTSHLSAVKRLVQRQPTFLPMGKFLTQKSWRANLECSQSYTIDHGAYHLLNKNRKNNCKPENHKNYFVPLVPLKMAHVRSLSFFKPVG